MDGCRQRHQSPDGASQHLQDDVAILHRRRQRVHSAVADEGKESNEAALGSDEVTPSRVHQVQTQAAAPEQRKVFRPSSLANLQAERKGRVVAPPPLPL